MAPNASVSSGVHHATLELERRLAARREQRGVRGVGREQVPLRGDVTADEERDARPEQASHELAAVDVVRGVGAQRPPSRRALEPPEVVHEPRDLELDVVGTRRL